MVEGLTWPDWMEAVQRLQSSSGDTTACSEVACSPSALDRGQCPPGRYAFRSVLRQSRSVGWPHSGYLCACRPSWVIGQAAFLTYVCVATSSALVDVPEHCLECSEACTHHPFTCIPKPHYALSRYDVSDSVGRSSRTLIFARVESGARHAVELTVTLATQTGREGLVEMVRVAY